MKKIFGLFFVLFIFFISSIATAEETKLLTAGISIVPKSFYGTWRVVSKRTNTNSEIFKEKSLDLWNLSRTGDVITLCNIFNGAKAQITINQADAKHIVFTKQSRQKDKELSDTVEINISGDYFEGIDKIEIKTYVDGKIVKSESAGYKIIGEKIGGGNITEQKFRGK